MSRRVYNQELARMVTRMTATSSSTNGVLYAAFLTM